MWLLKSHWSNPMQHLIPYLQDDQKAADSLRQLRWPDGVKCPRCGSNAVEPRERCDNRLQRFNCVPCAARCDPDGTCVHCNTMEGMWSGLRNFLDRFKGISQRFLHLRVGRYEFLHNHGHLNWSQTFEAALRYMFSTPGDYLRRMAHQHRRMPLTLCYR